MMIKLLFTFLIISLSATTLACEPNIMLIPIDTEVEEMQTGTIGIELDQACTTQVLVGVEFIDGTAIRGIHYEAQQIEYDRIPHQIGRVRFVALEDGQWSEDRHFSVVLHSTSHGVISKQPLTITIKNINPRLRLVFPERVQEPKEGEVIAPLKVVLNEPSKIEFEGKIRVIPLEATYGVDYIGFEPDLAYPFGFRKGEQEFVFPDHYQIHVLADDEDERDERILIIIDEIERATAEQRSYTMTITAPALKTYFSVEFISSIVIDGGEVQFNLSYNAAPEAIVDEDHHIVLNESAQANYSVSVRSPAPFPALRVVPGAMQIESITGDTQHLEQMTLGFNPSPKEFYPFVTTPQYLFMSMFGSFHQNRMVRSDLNPSFQFKDFKKTGPNEWEKRFQHQRRDREGGAKEETLIRVKARASH